MDRQSKYLGRERWISQSLTVRSVLCDARCCVGSSAAAARAALDRHLSQSGTLLAEILSTLFNLVRTLVHSDAAEYLQAVSLLSMLVSLSVLRWICCRYLPCCCRCVYLVHI